MVANNKRIAKNTLFLYFRLMLVMGVMLYTSRIVLLVLGAEDFGLYGAIGGLVTIFTFLNCSLSGATSRFLTFELGKKNYARLGDVFNAAIVTHFLFGLLIVLLCETVGMWFFYNKMVIPAARMDAAFWVFQISVLTCFLTMIQVPYDALIIAHENMKIYAYVGIAQALAQLAIVFLLGHSPIDKLIFYAILLCLLKILVMFFYRMFCRKYKESRVHLCNDFDLYKKMFAYTGSDLIGCVAGMAQGQGLNILLNMFFGPVVNAARAIVYQVQGAVSQFSNNFFTAAKPQIIKLYAAGDIKGMMQLVYFSSWFSFYLLLMMVIPLCLEADFILKLWLGKYPEHTDKFLVLVLVLCLIQAIKTPRTTVFHASGHLLLTNVVVGSILCSVFPIAYIVLKNGASPESVFWCANGTMLVSEIASVFILKRFIDYSIANYVLNVHIRCLFVALISVFVLFKFNRLFESGWVKFIITCIASIVIVGFNACILGVNKEFREKIKSFVVGKLHR